MQRLLFLTALLFSTGCTTTQLQFTTLNQSRTIPDLQQKQVMENFARLSADAGLLPYFDLVSVGTSAVTDRATATFTLMSAIEEFTKGDYGAEAEREISGNWTISPTNDPNRLAAMRAAYMIALGRDSEIAPIDLDRLDDFLTLNYDDYVEHRDPHRVIPSGWLCMGDKKTRPKQCHYIAHKNGVYVWVKDGRLKDLANFTLIILDIATLHPDSPEREPVQHDAAAKEFTSSELIQMNKPQLEMIDEQVAINNEQLKSIRENLSRKHAWKPGEKELSEKSADDISRRTEELMTRRNALVDSATRLSIDSMNREAVRARRSGAASRIPSRLNGPVLNQGMFLLPR